VLQAATPKLLKNTQRGQSPDGKTAQGLAVLLMLLPAAMAFALYQQLDPANVIIIGLSLFAIILALNSAVHSYLIVEWSDHDKVAMNVGFYYMANAGGRLTGTILSGLIYQQYSLVGCLIASSLFVGAATLLSTKLPRHA
jgi:predicted MFS family arabinose efflux permease